MKGSSTYFSDRNTFHKNGGDLTDTICSTFNIDHLMYNTYNILYIIIKQPSRSSLFIILTRIYLFIDIFIYRPKYIYKNYTQAIAFRLTQIYSWPNEGHCLISEYKKMSSLTRALNWKWPSLEDPVQLPPETEHRTCIFDSTPSLWIRQRHTIHYILKT